MKKILLRISIIILLYISLNSYVYASDTATVKVDTPSTCGVGDKIEVTISITGTSTGVQGFQGTFDYDKNILEYVSNKVLASGWIVTGYNEETGARRSAAFRPEEVPQ